MAFYSGTNGSLWIKDKTTNQLKKAARVRSWQVTSSVGMLDTTSLEDTDRTVTPGIRNTSGSCDLFYYRPSDGSSETNSASELLNKIIKARTGGGSEGIAAETDAVTLRLKINDGSTDGKYVEVDAYLTSAQMSMAVGQVLSAQISFDTIGAPTLVKI